MKGTAVTVTFNVEDGRYADFARNLQDFAALLSDDSVIEHAGAYDIVDVSEAAEKEGDDDEA